MSGALVRSLAGLCLSLLLVASGERAQAQGADAGPAEYAGRQVRFITMGSPGGGYDTYMRTLIPPLEKRLGAKLVPVNEAGAGGLVAMTRIIGAAPDGMTIALVGGEAIVTSQLYKLPGVHYDVRALTMLGRISAEDKVVLVSAKAPLSSVADMVKSDKAINWGGTGKADGNTDFGAVLVHATGMKSRIVLGYSGSGGINLAIQNGEIDARVVSDESAVLFTRAGTLKVISILARARSQQFADVGTVFEQVPVPAAGARLLDWRAGVAALGRIMITTPGAPDRHVTVLRKAITDVLADQEVVAEIKKRGLSPSHASADAARAMVDKAMGMLDEAGLAEMRSVVMERYY